MWSNIQVDFRLQAPICLSWSYLHFDGIIAHLASRQYDPIAYRKLDSKVVLRESRVEPIIYSRGIPHASVAILDDGLLTTHRIYKRFESVALFSLKQIKMNRGMKIRYGQGYFKSAAIKLATIPARTVTFFARCKLDRVIELLPALPGLGKKTSIGFGMIKSYKITELDEDYSVVRDGIATRQIPIKYLDEYNETYWGTYRPPYWSTEIEVCASPGSKVRLKSRTAIDKISRKKEKM